MVSLYSTIKMMHGPINIRFKKDEFSFIRYQSYLSQYAFPALYYLSLVEYIVLNEEVIQHRP